MEQVGSEDDFLAAMDRIEVIFKFAPEARPMKELKRLIDFVEVYRQGQSAECLAAMYLKRFRLFDVQPAESF